MYIENDSTCIMWSGVKFYIVQTAKVISIETWIKMKKNHISTSYKHIILETIHFFFQRISGNSVNRLYYTTIAND